jgi:ABC-type polysaccharide/polyol phosphate transport system ATPase subunit
MLNDFSYDFNKGDRIGIVGRNGVGKVSCSTQVLRMSSKPLSSRSR